MNRTVLYTLIGDLCNDPNHDRYTTSQIDTQLDLIQDRWNVDAGILVDTTTLTTVAGTRSYAVSGLTGTAIDFRRVTHLGLELVKRSKSWFDLYAGDDWSDDVGTPTQYYIDTDADGFFIVLYPTPQTADAGANLVVEYVKRHTSMANASDEPFNSLTYLGPYHYGVAYKAASNLLAQDPDPVNAAKAARFDRLAETAYSDLFQHFKQIEKDEPMRMTGGRWWR